MGPPARLRAPATSGERLALCYHAVSEEWPADLSVTPAALAEQAEQLLIKGYHGVTFSGLVNATSARKLVAITFDDGFRSVYERALPILTSFGLVGTLFVATSYVGKPEPMAWPGIEHWRSGPHRDELAPVSWEQVRELIGAGWEIGSHTHTHPRLSRSSDGELSVELERSKGICEQELGRPCASLAYPYGDFDRRVMDAARECGYGSAACLPGRFPDPSAYAWPRIGVYQNDTLSRFKLKISRPMIRLRRSVLWSVRDRSRPGGS